MKLRSVNHLTWVSIETFLTLQYAILVLLLVLVSCTSSEMEAEDNTIARIIITPDHESILALGQKVQMQVKAVNAAGRELASDVVSWSSSNPRVINVGGSDVIEGTGVGQATILAETGGKMDAIEFHVVDLSGTWIGGESPDTVTYILEQTDTLVTGVFQSRLGFPPITDVTTGKLTGYLQFARYFHTLEIITEDECELRISGAHTVEVRSGGELVLEPGSGNLSASNCNINGTIDFATLRRQ